MIRANELRIGNKVTERNNHRIYEVKNILLNSVVVKYWACGENEEISCNKLIPIPLTPEILESCRFEVNEKLGYYFKKINFNLLCLFLGDIVWVEKCKNEITIAQELKYLHQLQNLYFALTGEELKINLNVEAISR